ncbi:MAG: pyrroline-5-carboxylate reductase [Bdellovibrionaceae bacterium]|nr:pyrroline-5-carboxylate reductase [Pseudobdellovibrionaceae bacterium]
MMLKHKKIGFLGCGNMAQAIIQALIESGAAQASQIWVTNRSEGKLLKARQELGVQTLANNEELIDQCDTIFLAVKPQDLTEALEPIASSFHEGHLVLSLAAGFPMESLEALLPNVPMLVRVMPNTPASIRRAVVGYSLSTGAQVAENSVRELLAPLGYVVRCEEGEEFQALTVSCGSGTGFVLELMQYWQEWLEEHGFSAESARKMTVETFLGAALMAERQPQVPLQDMQDKVVSKKGVTAAGLQSMRELEIERALRYSFEKAALRDTELASRT